MKTAMLKTNAKAIKSYLGINHLHVDNSLGFSISQLESDYSGFILT
jgi:hypothetical protein